MIGCESELHLIEEKDCNSSTQHDTQDPLFPTQKTIFTFDSLASTIEHASDQ